MSRTARTVRPFHLLFTPCVETWSRSDLSILYFTVALLFPGEMLFDPAHSKSNVWALYYTTALVRRFHSPAGRITWN